MGGGIYKGGVNSGLLDVVGKEGEGRQAREGDLGVKWVGEKSNEQCRVSCGERVFGQGGEGRRVFGQGEEGRRVFGQGEEGRKECLNRAESRRGFLDRAEKGG